MTFAEAAQIMMSGDGGTGGKVKKLDITENGEYTLSDEEKKEGYIGYTPVNVDVDGFDQRSVTFTDNGSYYAPYADKGGLEYVWNQVTVRVNNQPVIKPITIIEPGIYYPASFDCDGFDPVNGSDKYKKMYEYAKSAVTIDMADTGIPLYNPDGTTDGYTRAIQDTTAIGSVQEAIAGMQAECQSVDAPFCVTVDNTKMTMFRKGARSNIWVVSGGRLYSYGLNVTKYTGYDRFRVSAGVTSWGTSIEGTDTENDGGILIDNVRSYNDLRFKSLEINGNTAKYTVSCSKYTYSAYTSDKAPEFTDYTVTCNLPIYGCATSGTVYWGGSLSFVKSS